MRILHITPSMDPRGGGVAASILIRGLQLKKMGHVVEVVTLDRPNQGFLRGHPLTIFALGPGISEWEVSTRLWKWLAANAASFDAVIVDGLWKYQSFCAGKVLSRLRIKYYVIAHGMLDPWFSQNSRLSHIKKLLFWNWCEAPLIRHAEALIFTCARERDLACTSFAPYHTKLAISTLGVTDPPPVANLPSKNTLFSSERWPKRPYLLFLGRIHEKKGCDILLESYVKSLAMNERYDLVIAGPAEGTILNSLKGFADANSVSHKIYWPGMLTGDRKWRALADCSAFILLSHQENFGIAVVEAMASRRPIIVSNEVNIAEDIKCAGLLCEDNCESLTEALNQFAGLDSSELAQLSQNSYQVYQKSFTAAHSASSLIGVIVDTVRHT